MSVGGIQLWVGPDRPRKLQRLHALERSLGIQPFDRHTLEATAVEAPQLIALCRQQPAASPMRLIVIEDAQRLTARCIDALLHHAAAIASTACVLLFVEIDVPPRHPLAQPQVTERFTIEPFPLRESSSAKPFALTDALGAADAAAALSALHDQLQGGKEPLELLGLMGWQLQRWMTIKRLQQLGYGTEEIASLTGLRVWHVQRLQREVARRSPAALQRWLKRCWQLDVDAKRGRTLPGLAVEQLVLEVCQPSSV